MEGWYCRGIGGIWQGTMAASLVAGRPRCSARFTGNSLGIEMFGLPMQCPTSQGMKRWEICSGSLRTARSDVLSVNLCCQYNCFVGKNGFVGKKCFVVKMCCQLIKPKLFSSSRTPCLRATRFSTGTRQNIWLSKATSKFLWIINPFPIDMKTRRNCLFKGPSILLIHHLNKPVKMLITNRSLLPLSSKDSDSQDSDEK